VREGVLGGVGAEERDGVPVPDLEAVPDADLVVEAVLDGVAEEERDSEVEDVGVGEVVALLDTEEVELGEGSGERQL